MRKAPKRPHIKIFTCGGTLDKVYREVRSTMNFSLGEAAVKEIFDGLRLNLDYDIEPLLSKDSLEMTAADRRLVRNACERTHRDRILITHGTDTMTKTAKELSRVTGKVIVLTGAAQPYRFRDSDATFNIGVALGALEVLSPGVYVAMNGRVYDWDKCQKLADGRFVEK